MIDLGKLKLTITTNANEAANDLGKLKEGTETASTGFSNLKSIIAKLGLAAMAAKAAKAIVDLGKQSLELYAQYEQLTGGIETLFKDSQDIVMGYAENAYKTAGMSAN